MAAEATDRFVVIPIDDLMRLLVDYAGDALQLPADARPLKLMLKPTEKGKLGLQVYSDTWEQDQRPEQVNFHLKRFYSV